MYIFHVTRLLRLSAHYCLLFGTCRGLPHRQMPSWLEWIWPAWPAPRCLPGTISRVPWYIFRWLVCLGLLHALVGKPGHCCASCLSHDPCHPPANAQLHQRWGAQPELPEVCYCTLAIQPKTSRHEELFLCLHLGPRIHLFLCLSWNHHLQQLRYMQQLHGSTCCFNRPPPSSPREARNKHPPACWGLHSHGLPMVWMVI